MNYIVLSMGIVACIAGLAAMLLSRILVDWARQLDVTTPFRLLAASARIAAGALLVYAATPTGHPLIVQILGYLCLLDGFAGLVISNQIEQRLIHAVFGQNTLFPRIGGLALFLLGLFLMYTGIPAMA